MNQLDLFAAPPLAPGQLSPSERASQEAQARRREGEEAERRKQEGMQRATWGKERLLGHAREIALDIARGVLPHADGSVTSGAWTCNADDIAAQFEREGLPWIGNAAGSIFVDRNWEAVGLVKSCRPHAHKNLLRQWKWKHKESS
jgi:hypothetical protein